MINLEQVLDRVGRDLALLAAIDSSQFNDDVLMGCVVALESVGRLADSLRISWAVEVAERSRHELGDDGLAARNGHKNANNFLQTVTGISAKTAQKRIALGATVKSTPSATSLMNVSRFPELEAAFFEGRVGVDVAFAIVDVLKPLTARCSLDAVAKGEHELVEAAVGSAQSLPAPADQIARMALVWREFLDPDGALPADAALQAQRKLTLGRERNGMTPVYGQLTPLQAGVWRSALDAHTNPRVKPTFQSVDDAAEAELLADTRTPEQSRADVITSLIDAAAQLTVAPRINGAAPTVNVTLTLADLTSGRGVGWIDGIEEPIPVQTVQQLVCDSEVVSTLLGNHGEVLFHGKSKRIFTAKQRRAMAVRDGGCVMPGCTAPPSRCEAHHVEPWLHDGHPGGLTDIDNGALVCHWHHSHLHKLDWELGMIRGKPHVVPPRWADPERKPIPVGQQRAGWRPAA